MGWGRHFCWNASVTIRPLMLIPAQGVGSHLSIDGCSCRLYQNPEEGTSAHSLRRCVFAAGLLCVRPFCSALLVLQASDACPGALQIIAHCDVQRAAALTGELDVVAVHERIEPSMVGACCENVAGVQRVNRGDPFNAARNLMRHVVSVEILHDNTVVC